MRHARIVAGRQSHRVLGRASQRCRTLLHRIRSAFPLLALALLPFSLHAPNTAIFVIIAANALITFATNFANPAWTAIVADIVPREYCARFFSHRNLAINLPTLLVVPLAGWLIQAGKRPTAPAAGYQIIFAMALVSGAVATLAFSRVDDPMPEMQARPHLRLCEMSREIRNAPVFLGLVACTLIWNLGAGQVAAPS